VHRALRDRCSHRAARPREPLRTGHLPPVAYDGELARMIRMLRLINDDLGGPASSSAPTRGAPMTNTPTE